MAQREPTSESTTEASCERLWQLALPYLDTRENATHTRIALDLARCLMKTEGGDAGVIIPAVILHDVGWKRIPEDQQLKAFGPGASSPELNRRHEVEGVKIARTLLKEVSYDRSRTCEILAIVDGHDSRPKALSKNDALVKDADKLWRYTPEGFGIDRNRFNETCRQGLARLRDHLEGWFLTATGIQLARNLLSQRMEEKCEDGWTTADHTAGT